MERGKQSHKPKQYGSRFETKSIANEPVRAILRVHQIMLPLPLEQGADGTVVDSIRRCRVFSLVLFGRKANFGNEQRDALTASEESSLVRVGRVEAPKPRCHPTTSPISKQRSFQFLPASAAEFREPLPEHGKHGRDNDCCRHARQTRPHEHAEHKRRQRQRQRPESGLNVVPVRQDRLHQSSTSSTVE